MKDIISYLSNVFGTVKSAIDKKLFYALCMGLLVVLLLGSFSCKVIITPLEKEEVSERVKERGSFVEQIDPREVIDPDWEPKIIPYFIENAVDIKVLLDSAAADPLATTEKYAHTETDENTNYNFIVKGTGRIISVNEGSKGSVNIDLPPYDNTPDIQIIIGPIISSTLNSIRDAYDDLSYGDFTHQIDWKNVGLRIKEIIKDTVLKEIIGDTKLSDQVRENQKNLVDKTAAFYGAFTLRTPDDYSKIEITPIKLEIGEN